MNIFWSKYTQLEAATSLADPLAFDYMAQQLGYLILPNFTTRTSRARYYSMVCFGLRVCEKALKRENKIINDNNVKEYFEAYEKLWAIAVAEIYNGDLNKKELDMRGKQGAVRAVKENIRAIDGSFKLLSRQLELGSLGAYRSSLESYGYIKQGTLALTIKGNDLANSFLHVATGTLSQYEELIIRSICSKRAEEKYGNISLKSFGNLAKLGKRWNTLRYLKNPASNAKLDFLIEAFFGNFLYIVILFSYELFKINI